LRFTRFEVSDRGTFVERRGVVTYSIFNRDSGNLIESYRSERRALELIAEMLEDDENDPEMIALVLTEKGQTVRVVTGDDLREVAAPHARRVSA
jgi:hypothetical protein